MKISITENDIKYMTNECVGRLLEDIDSAAPSDSNRWLADMLRHREERYNQERADNPNIVLIKNAGPTYNNLSNGLTPVKSNPAQTEKQEPETDTTTNPDPDATNPVTTDDEITSGEEIRYDGNRSKTEKALGGGKHGIGKAFWSAQQTQIKIPVWISDEKSGSQTLTINKHLAPQVKAIFQDIYNIKDPKWGRFKISQVGGFNYRHVRGGSWNRIPEEQRPMSNHSKGGAIDINWSVNPFSKGAKGEDNDTMVRTTNHPVVQAFARHGFGWGGSYGDYMHFSIFAGH